MTEQSSVPPPPETSRGGRAGKRNDKAAGLLKILNLGLLAFVLFGWLAWIILLAGVSAVTNTARDLNTRAPYDNASLTSLTWVVTWYLFIMLIALTFSACGSVISSKLRGMTALVNRGMTFFLAVLVAWLGIDCNDYARYHRTLDGGNFGSRVNTVLAGEILALIACFSIVLSLLSIDHLHSHSDKFNKKADEVQAKRESKESSAPAPPKESGSHVTGGGPVQRPVSTVSQGELQRPVSTGAPAEAREGAATQPAAASSVPPYNPGPHAAQV